MARVLLFNPPGPENKAFTREGRCTQEAGIWATQWPPVSLATAAALLERDGRRVSVIDFPACGAGEALLRETILREQPDFAFWATGTPTLDYDLSLARLFRRLSPRTRTGVMGTHVTVQPESALTAAPLDVVVRREPERIILEFCRAGADDDSPEFMAAIAGISYRDPATGAIRHNPDAEFLAPEEIPPPAWRFVDTSRYRLPFTGRPFLIVAPIRGCPYRCTFCTAPVYYGRKLRKRPIVRVVDEMEHNVGRFGIRDFFIWADTFTADREYVHSFCREILRRGLASCSWTCNSRVDTVDRETLALMKRAGLWMISFGFESGNEDILKAARKGITPAQSVAAATAAGELGIAVAGHFIFGLPGETEKTMEQTLQLALDLPLDIAQFYVAAPFPGTELHARAVRSGGLKPEASLFGQSAAVLDLPGLPASRVDAFRRRAYRKFYMRPAAAKRILGLLQPGAVGHAAGGSLRFLKWVFGR